MKSSPDVFIIESLNFEDEEAARGEGTFLAHILKLAGRQHKYFYIRTRAELEEVLDRFDDSGFRYLHISCHADPKGIALTLDHLSLSELGRILRPHLDNRRVFFSACELATKQLAGQLIRGTDCYSVIAPCQAIGFDEAALFWASLYHLMFKSDKLVMKRQDLTRNLRALSELFDVRVRYFSSDAATTQGFREITLGASAQA
jgi:hypothetical protein